MAEGQGRSGRSVVVQGEPSMPLYKNQPVFGDVDLALRSLGFVPHTFANINKRMILPVHFGDNPYASLNQLLEADIVYVRDFTQPDKMNSEQLKHLALVAHHCYASYDLAANCIHNLIAKGTLPNNSVEKYLAIIKAH